MRRPRRLPSGLALAAVAALAFPAVAASVPPAPPNPGEDEIQSQRDLAADRAGRVGELTQRLAEAESRLDDLGARVELSMETANKARVDLTRAERASTRAEQAAASARAESAAAAGEVERQRARLDRFAAASYRQGSKVGSLTAFIGTRGPQELLDRAEMLDTISRTQLDVLDDLERARIEQVNKDSLARKALGEAAAKRAAAGEARRQAEAAQAAAISAQQGQSAAASRLSADRDGVQAELATARSSVQGMEAQRDRYQEWLAAREAEQQAQAAAAPPPQAATGDSGDSGGSSDSEDSAPASGDVETVIRRATSQVGMPYAWGGGDADGPTQGIRDGGVADAHGDYKKVGFDCSGLMVYAFAAAGVELDHYSGYQYQAGEQVPLSQIKRGDMLFWRSSGQVHHVALYLGGGRMVEAPYSGSEVRVTSVRYAGIAPYAARLL